MASSLLARTVLLTLRIVLQRFQHHLVNLAGRQVPHWPCGGAMGSQMFVHGTLLPIRDVRS